MAKFGYCNTCKKELLSKDSFKLTRGKKICLECLEEKVSTALSTESDKEVLIEFIKELFKVEIVNDGWISQIDKFVKNKGYSYKGIRSTLNYFYNILENPVNPDYGLGIIEYTYNEAKKYYQLLNESNQYNNSIEYEPTTQIITIKPPNRAVRIKTNMEDL